MDLSVLGEANGQVSERFKEQNDQIPWHEMKGLRNRVIHGYFNVRHEVVWRVLTTEFPALLPQIDDLDKKLDQSPDS